MNSIVTICQDNYLPLFNFDSATFSPDTADRTAKHVQHSLISQGKKNHDWI